MNEMKINHLQMIQNIISRMAQNSFALKGWAATLVAAAFALASKDANIWFILVALIPTVAFCLLDAYYLRLERLFRELYNDVRKWNDEKINNEPFTMDISNYQEKVTSWFCIIWTSSVIGYYGPILLVIIGAALLCIKK